jgi:hypothetical protein
VRFYVLLHAFAKNVAFRFEWWRSPVFKGALPASANDCRELEEQAARSTSQQLKPSLVNSLHYAKGAFGHTFHIFQVVCRFALLNLKPTFWMCAMSSQKVSPQLFKQRHLRSFEGRADRGDGPDFILRRFVGWVKDWDCVQWKGTRKPSKIYVHVALINLDHKIS